MKTFALTCRDKPGASALRRETRPEHLAYLGEADVTVLLGGALLDDADQPAGSLLIIEAEDLAAAEQFAQNDPYTRAGLFDSVEIRPYRLAAGALLAEGPLHLEEEVGSRGSQHLAQRPRDLRRFL
ncbi:MAG: YciI family protein, partial [Pseudomonadota bacterium]